MLMGRDNGTSNGPSGYGKKRGIVGRRRRYRCTGRAAAGMGPYAPERLDTPSEKQVA